MKVILSIACFLFSLSVFPYEEEDESPADSTGKSRKLSEVVVMSSAKKLSTAEIGAENVQLQDVHKLPSLFGERDVIRSLQFLPGVKANNDGSSGFQVRGGTTGQNHIILDDATVYNAGHLMGLFSTFNDGIIASATLYKGTPPAQYGGGSSSVLNVVTKKAQPEFKLAGTIGILSAKLYADIPISKKIAAFVSARRTYFDLFLMMVKKYRNISMNFYDLNAKVNFDFNERNRLFVSFFRGRDNMGMEELMNTGWDNTLGNIRYWHAFNDTHEMSTSVFLSSYSIDGSMDLSDINNSYNSGIKHFGLKQSFEWNPTDAVSLNYGIQTRYTDLASIRVKANDTDLEEKRQAWENDIWAGVDWNVNDWLSVNAGIRMNIFTVLGGSPLYEIDKDGEITKTYNYSCGKFVKTYLTPEPRFTANIKVNPTASVKLGYARTGQNIRPLYNNGMMETFNRYTMTSNIFHPETANLVSVGWVKAINGGAYELSVEGYYKTLNDVLDYKDGKNFTSAVEVERTILAGKGRSYGFEVLGKKNTGKLTGWISYTLAWTQNKIDGINNGKWYTAPNDRRHDISVAAIYQITPKWNISATWMFLSGQAMTIPSAKYDISGETIYYYGDRNAYRAPAYHRLDISATYERHHKTKKGRKWSSEWVFGIYNVYNRYNPYSITFKNDSMLQTGTRAKMTALFGLLPSVSYSFYF